MSRELLPCPFCGDTEPQLHSASFYVMCDGCGAEGPWNDDNEDAAITAWNLRTALAEPEYDTPEWWAKVRKHDAEKHGITGENP